MITTKVKGEIKVLESKDFIATPPGVVIKEQIKSRGIKQSELAQRMDFSEKHISKLINGEVRLKPETAERLEMVLGIPAAFWNKLELIYREKLIKVNNENNLQDEIKLLSSYPYKQLEKLNIIKKAESKEQAVINLRKFFEVSRLDIVTEKNIMPIACRRLSITDKGTKALLVLAQYAKLQSRNEEIKSFSCDKLRKVIPEIRKLAKHRSYDFFDNLKQLLADCGVALIQLPNITGSYLHGISFYDKNKVVLGISLRGKYADKFWFSLFHEIAHILQGHIYNENGTSTDDEKEADVIAANIMIPKQSIENFYRNGDFSPAAIRLFADKVNTDEGIVVGRLQTDKKIKYNQFNNYKIQYYL